MTEPFGGRGEHTLDARINLDRAIEELDVYGLNEALYDHELETGWPTCPLYATQHWIEGSGSRYRDEVTLANLLLWLPVVAREVRRPGASMTDGWAEFPGGAPPGAVAWRVVIDGGHYRVLVRDETGGLSPAGRSVAF